MKEKVVKKNLECEKHEKKSVKSSRIHTFRVHMNKRQKKTKSFFYQVEMSPKFYEKNQIQNDIEEHIQL